jgi:hypothetical protein
MSDILQNMSKHIRLDTVTTQIIIQIKKLTFKMNTNLEFI